MVQFISDSAIFYFFRDKTLTRIESLSISIDILNGLLKLVIPGNGDENETEKEKNADLEQHDTSFEATQNHLLPNFQDSSPLTDKNESSLELIALLKLLIKLACMQIKNGENPNYAFASILPKLFYQTNTSIIIPANVPLLFLPNVVTKKSVVPCRVDKRKFSCDVIELCISCYVTCKLRSNVVFQICGVMLPKLVKNLDRTGLVEPLKFQLLQGNYFFHLFIIIHQISVLADNKIT